MTSTCDICKKEVSSKDIHFYVLFACPKCMSDKKVAIIKSQGKVEDKK